MAKSIIWVVVVGLLIGLLGRRIFPGLLQANQFLLFGFTLIPYVWLLVLAIRSLVSSISRRKKSAEA